VKESVKFTARVGTRELTLETGKLAQLAGGSVVAREGDTMMMAAATMSKTPREGIDFFPLSVDYEERLYAAGRIPGSFFRREGRPTEAAILIARLTDRPLRPLFPSDLRNDVQIILTALSADQVYHIDILGVIAASAALTISDIPFYGPVGAVRIGLIDGQLVVNPTIQELEHSRLDLRVAGTADAIMMVEAGAEEVDERTMVEALRLAHQSIQPIVKLQEEMRAAVGKPKVEDYPRFAPSAALEQAIAARLNGRVGQAIDQTNTKEERQAALDALEDEVVAAFAAPDAQPLPGESAPAKADHVKRVFHDLMQVAVRERILKGVRPDGRDLKTIRPLAAEAGLLPRAHGSGLFTRGETQVLSIATLGTPGEAQELDGLHPDDTKRYMHHYNFPPYSVGETRPLRGSSRREIGHGALAERALVPVLPDPQTFAYTLRVVSEVLSSNGSTSMASVCGSTLALMDAGVPILKPVAGIAMGLIMERGEYAVLTDIQGIEDHLGDMDFKVAGTADGITALQMDIKVKGITPEIMEKALAQAREARLQILQVILNAIPTPRSELSPYAPRMTILHIPVDKIGMLIGPGGKTVRGIQEQTGVKIDIEDDGTVFVSGVDGLSTDRALEIVRGLVATAEIGKVYTGKVVRTTDFGAFVEFLPGQDGMVHISQLADHRVERVEDVVRVGDEVMVMVTDIDPAGKVRLSRQAVLEGWTADEARERDRGGRPSGGGGDRGRGGERGGRGGDRGGDRGGGGDHGRSGGGRR
jgi:polyribonucleotide nucleotidyltransferase